MKLWIINPQARGYLVDCKDSTTKKTEKHAHNKRITAVNEILRQIPANRQFQITFDEEEK